jgi:PST family polysaccharide transporter
MAGKFSSSLSARILKAMSVFGGVQCLTILCSIVRTKLAAIWIGPMGVGLISIFNSTMDMLTSTGQLNIRQSAVRDIAAADSDKRPILISTTRRLARTLGVIGTILVLLCSPLLSKMSFDTYEYWWGFAILSLMMLFSATSAGELAILQSLNHLKPLARVGLYVAIFSTCCAIPLFYFFRLKAVVPVILIFSASQMFFALRERKDSVKQIKMSLRQAFANGHSILALGAWMTAASFVTMLFSYLFIIWLNRTSSTETVGIYQAGYTLVNSYVGIIFTAISMEYYPRLSAIIKHTRRASTIVSHEMSICLSILIPVIVVFISCDKILTQLLYTSKFMDMLPYISIAICGVLFRAVSWCMAYVILAKGDGKMFIISEIVSATIGITLNILGFKMGSWIGLGISYVAWYAAYTIITYLIYRIRYHMTLSRGIWLQLAFGVIISAATLAIRFACSWWIPLIVILPWLLPITIKRLMRK